MRKKLLLVGAVVASALVALLAGLGEGLRPRTEPAQRVEAAGESAGAVLQADADTAEDEHDASAREPLGARRRVRLTSVAGLPSKFGSSKDLQPVADVRFGIDLVERVRRNLAPRWTGTTDGDGVAELELPPDAGDAALAARVLEPGKLSPTVHLRPDGSGVLHGELRVHDGRTVRGIARDGDGAPTSANVRALPIQPPRSSRTRTTDGWWEIDIVGPDPVDVVAEGHEVGTAALRDLDVRALAEDAVVELRLVGEGILRGRVLDSTGRPAAGLRLDARIAFDPLHERRPTNEELQRRGQGNVRGWTTTDLDGRFELVGLLPGDYVLYAGDVDGVDDGHRSLTEQPVATGGPPLDLVHDFTRLTVRVAGPGVEPSGAWAERTRRELDAWRANPGRPRRWESPWPVAPRLEVWPAGRERRMPWSEVGWEHWEEHARVERGDRFAFRVEPGASYDVALAGGSTPFVVDRVTIPAEGGLVEHVLHVPAESGSGVLVLRPSAPSSDEEPRVDFTLHDPATGFVLWRSELVPLAEKPDGIRLELPAGTYEVEFEGRNHVGGHGELWSARSIGRWTEVVELAAGEERLVAPRLDRGARLELTPIPGDASVEREGHARFELLAPRRPALEVLFVHESSHEFLPNGIRVAIQLGETRTSLPLPAGRFTLRTTWPDDTTTDQPVTLRAGETTKVVVRR